jgi:hypothetical protein
MRSGSPSISVIIPSMLIVAGPSGVGKSAFLSDLASGNLSREIWANLPIGCDCWQEVAARGLSAHLEGRSPIDRSNIALHYDLNNTIRLGASNYFENPTAEGVACTKEIVVVTIRASSERLQAQLLHRCFGGSNEAETRAAMRRETHLSPPVRDNLRFAQCYAQPGWLEAQSNLWSDFLSRLTMGGRLARQLDIAPIGNIYERRETTWSLIGTKVRASSV